MEFDIITRAFLAVVSLLGSVTAVFLYARQAEKIKSELLEKFELALEKSQKHSVTELFRLIHGLRMSYSDIVELIKHDECIKIIYSIKKTPGIVCYENGQFSYTNMGERSVYQLTNRWITKIGIYFFSGLFIISLITMLIGSGLLAVIGFIFMLISAVMLAMDMKQHRYDQMVANLIHTNHGNLPD